MLKYTNLFFVGGSLLFMGACTTYQTSTEVLPKKAPGFYFARTTVEKHAPLRRPVTVMNATTTFTKESGSRTWGGLREPDGQLRQVKSISITVPENYPKKAEVHYFIEPQPGFPALDRREWVELPGAQERLPAD